MITNTEFMLFPAAYPHAAANYENEDDTMKIVLKIGSVFLTAAMLFSLLGCQKTPENSYDVPKLANAILEQVTFAEKMEAMDDAAAFLIFSDLPEGATVKLYTSISGYVADELALITLTKTSDTTTALASVKTHLTQVKNQFANYIPEELDKIEKALIWSHENYVILCISDNVSDAKLILDNAGNPDFRLPNAGNHETPDNGGNETPDNGGNETPDNGGNETPDNGGNETPDNGGNETPDNGGNETPDYEGPVNADGYPLLQSQSGTYKFVNGLLVVDNAAFETCGYSDGVASSYADLINQAGSALAGITNVYCLAIPKSIGIMVPDDIQAIYSGYPNQNQHIENVFAKLSPNVTPVRCFDNLMRHRNEYLYFRTDHHWNGIGAYYAYEAFCEAKGITPYTMAQREEVKYENYYGTLANSGVQPADTVFAYKPYSKSATMSFYQNDGKYVANWPIISSAKNYNCFAASDQPLAIFKNPEVTDGSVCIVVKESFGNALLPYLVDHYSTIYEIDYRYWTGNLMDYAVEVGATDMIFANNIMMISTSLLVGKLADNIQK